MALRTARLKFARAVEHQTVFRDALDHYGSQTRLLRTQSAVGDETHIVYSFEEPEHQPFDAWSLIVGDILFNFRCALDHAIYQLAVVVGGVDPPAGFRQLQFPVFATEDTWNKKHAGMLGALTQNAAIVAAVRSYQPFLQPNGQTPLSALTDLNNIDKHRTLAIFNVVPQQAQLPLRFRPRSARPGQEVRWIQAPLQRLTNGLEIFRIIVPPDWEISEEMPVAPNLQSFPVIAYPTADQFIPAQETLTMIEEVIDVVLEHLEEFP